MNMDAHRESILVVDDDFIIRQTLQMILNPHYNVAMAESGEDALKSLQRETFDLVTLDIDMPGLSGIDTLAQIKKRWPCLAVVMVSGHGNLANAQAAILKGASTFISKPFHIAEVLKVVGKILERNRDNQDDLPREVSVTNPV
jgi:DNA-binding NtrC family response regulator